MKRTTMMVALAAVLLVGAAGCVNRPAQAQSKRTQELLGKESKPVGVATVRSQTLKETLPMTGQVAISADSQVGAKISGKLVAVFVKDGDPVSAGQTIAELDTSSLRIQVQQAMAGVSAARSQYNQAMANARIAPSRSRAAVRSAEAQIRAAKAQLSKALAGARPEERAQAEASVRAAKSGMELAKRTRDRQANLLKEGATSQAAYEQAENAYQAALAQYEQALEGQRLTNNATRSEDIESAREAVRQAEEGLRTAQANQRLDVTFNDQVRAAQANVESAQSALRLAQQAMSDARVTAPFAGTIYGNPAQPGSVVAPGAPVARLVGREGLYFEADVPSSALSIVKVGATVTVRVEGVDGPLLGSVIAISPSASSVGRLFRARVSLPMAGEALKPGLFARGEATLREVQGARVVPIGALQRRGDKRVVYVVSGTTVKEVTVEVGIEKDDVAQVIGGVSPGDEVVVQGAGDLSDGSTIEIRSTAAKEG